MWEQRLCMYLPLAALLAWAAATDVRSRRIPNWITFSLLLGGLLQSATEQRSVDPMGAVTGLLTGFSVGIVIHIMGGLGAGDVKLLSAVGAWLGASGVLAVFAIAALTGLVAILGQCLAEGKLKTLLASTGLMVIHLATTSRLGVWHMASAGRGYRSVARPVPYAAMVLIGTVTVILLREGVL